MTCLDNKQNYSSVHYRVKYCTENGQEYSKEIIKQKWKENCKFVDSHTIITNK